MFLLPSDFQLAHKHLSFTLARFCCLHSSVLAKWGACGAVSLLNAKGSDAISVYLVLLILAFYFYISPAIMDCRLAKFNLRGRAWHSASHQIGSIYIYINIYLCVCVCAPLVTSSALLQCSKANRQRGSNTKASLFANTRVFGLGPRPCASSLERIRPRMRIRVLILVTHLVEVSLRILVGQVSLRTVSDCFELWPLRLKQSQDIEKNPCPAWHNANCCNCLSRRRRALGVERVSRSVHSN